MDVNIVAYFIGGTEEQDKLLKIDLKDYSKKFIIYN